MSETIVQGVNLTHIFKIVMKIAHDNFVQWNQGVIWKAVSSLPNSWAR
jgi:hypothetical protein